MSRSLIRRGVLTLAVVLVVTALATVRNFAARNSPSILVLTDWSTDGPLQVMLNEEGPQVRKVKLESDGSYLIDGRKYHVRREEATKAYEQLRIESRLSTRDGELQFDAKKVRLPDEVKMRDVWQAILVEGWVVCIGRTSRTDFMIKMRPPFVSSELVTFSVARMHARVGDLSFNVPNDVRLYAVKRSVGH